MMEAGTKDRVAPGGAAAGWDLIVAAFGGRRGEVERLLAQGVGVDTLGPRKRTPLHHAAFNGHAGVVSLLLERGAAADVLDEFGMTPAATAAFNGHDDVVSLLRRSNR